MNQQIEEIIYDKLQNSCVLLNANEPIKNSDFTLENRRGVIHYIADVGYLIGVKEGDRYNPIKMAEIFRRLKDFE